MAGRKNLSIASLEGGSGPESVTTAAPEKRAGATSPAAGIVMRTTTGSAAGRGTATVRGTATGIAKERGRGSIGTARWCWR